MRYKRKLAAALLICLCLTGCTEVVYDYSSYQNQSGYDNNSSSQDNSDQESDAPPANITTEHMLSSVKVNPADFSKTIEAETLAGGTVQTLTEGYSGKGYTNMDGSLGFSLDLPSTQYYKLDITAYALKGGSVSLFVDGELYGAYRIPQTTVFSKYSVCPIYLEQGNHSVILQCTGNIVGLDKIVIKNTGKTDSVRYTDAKKWLSGKDINDNRLALMDYLKSIYGKKSLLAQYCTPGTNAEIEAIYKATGRYPAVRCGELMYYTEAGERLHNAPAGDIELSMDWAASGGIVSYSWYWYSPIGKTTLYSKDCEMLLDEITTTKEDIAIFTAEELELLKESGSLSKEFYAVLSDMDKIAHQLSRLKAKGVAVLFRPLPGSEDKRYWWERSPELYRRLWQVMHRRFDELYGLSNIIWVCSATDVQYCPGEDYIDIIGVDFYNDSKTSGLWAMLKTDVLTLSTRMVALTECAAAVDPDLMNQDNCIWLWAAPWCGDYLVDKYGELNNKHIKERQLRKVYNHELTIAKDELKIKDFMP